MKGKCPKCHGEVDLGGDVRNHPRKVDSTFTCSHCGAELQMKSHNPPLVVLFTKPVEHKIGNAKRPSPAKPQTVTRTQGVHTDTNQTSDHSHDTGADGLVDNQQESGVSRPQPGTPQTVSRTQE